MNFRFIAGTLLVLGAIVALNARPRVPSETQAQGRLADPESAGVETVQIVSGFGSGRNTDSMVIAPSSVWPDVKLPTIKKATKWEPQVKVKSEPVTTKKRRPKSGKAHVPIRTPTQVSNSGHIL
jgi:hypothetical protein